MRITFLLLLAASLGAAEVRLGPEVPLVRSANGNTTNVAIAWTDSRVMGVWRSEDASEIVGAFDGGAFSIERLPGHRLGMPSVAAGRDRFLVAWYDLDGEQTRMLARRYTLDAMPVDPIPFVIPTAAAVRNAFEAPGVTADGDSFVISDVANGRLRLLRLNAGGTLSEILARDVSAEPSASFPPLKTTSEWVVPYLRFVGIANPRGFMEPFFSPTAVRIAFSGSDASSVDTSSSIPTDIVPRVATARTGNQFAYATPTLRDAGVRVGLERGSPAGQLLPQSSDVEAVDIAWNGSEYVVVWTTRSYGSIRAMRLDASGRLLDAAPFDVASRGIATKPSIAVTDRGVIIAYSRSDPEAGNAPRAFTRTLDRLPLLSRRQSVRH